MAGTIIPSSNNELLAWATNYKTKIPEFVTLLNMPPEQVAEEISWCNEFITSIFEVTAQKRTYKSILTKRNNTIKQVKNKFQKRIAQQKLAQVILKQWVTQWA